MSDSPSIFTARWFRFGAIGFVAVVLTVVILAYTLVDTRKIASVASAAVQKSTGRALTIKGDVSLKLFPYLSIVAADVAFGNASWATDPDMVKADQVSLNLDWMPLLHEQVSINEVALSGVTLNIQAAPKVQKVAGNWDLSSADTPSSKESNGSEAFNLHEIHLSNVTVQIRDERGAITQSVVVDQMNGSLNETQVDFDGQVRWQLQPVSLKGRLVFKPDAPLALTLNLQSDKIDLKAAVGSAPSNGSRSNQRWVFGTDALGFDALPLWNGHITAAINTLVLPDGVTLPNAVEGRPARKSSSRCPGA